jgi:hypothetical protein
MKTILERETDRQVRRAAHRVLRLHDPVYRAATDHLARARTGSSSDD